MKKQQQQQNTTFVTAVLAATCTLVLLSVALAHGDDAGVNHVPTPFGLMPETCVHRVRSGSTIRQVEAGVLVAHPEGDLELPTRPECVAWLKERLAATEVRHQQGSLARPAPDDGWLDYVGYYTPQLVQYFSGRYSVPETPKQGSALLYYFIGTENFQTGVGTTILQPVLTHYDKEGGWSFSSWNCCPGGQAHQSTPIYGFGPGTILEGQIDQSQDNWKVTSIFGNKATSLTVPDAGRDFNWVDVTLETYYVTECSQYATGPASFFDMKLVLSDGTAVAPVWSIDSKPSECNGKLTVASPFNVTISHN